MLGDISNINNNIDLLYIITAALIVDLVVIIIGRKTNLFGQQIKLWYDKFGLSAVLVDVFIIVIGIILTRDVFSITKMEFRPEYFIMIAVIITLVHDVLLYKYIVEPSTPGQNQIIDIYRDYTKENGYKILIADTTMIAFSCLIAMFLKNRELHETTSLLILTLYLVPYYVYSKY